MASHKHRRAMIKVLSEIEVPIDASPDKVIALLSTTNRSAITFTVMTEGKNHTKALYVTVECKRIRIPMVLVDNGSAINVCPLRVAKRLGLSSQNLTPSTQIVRAYDNTKREVAGVLTV